VREIDKERGRSFNLTKKGIGASFGVENTTVSKSRVHLKAELYSNSQISETIANSIIE
jgi:hypothetical protein